MAVVDGTGTRSELVGELEEILGPSGVLWDSYDLALYEYDGSIDRHRPEAVVFPTSAEQV
jgi:glycolate oxidase